MAGNGPPRTFESEHDLPVPGGPLFLSAGSTSSRHRTRGAGLHAARSLSQWTERFRLPRLDRRGAVLANRNPLLLFRLSGVFLFRFEERQFLALLFHEPPRRTRDVGHRPRQKLYAKALANASGKYPPGSHGPIASRFVVARPRR